MWYDYRFRAYPDRTGVTADAQRHIDIHRQADNHTRYEYNALDTDEDSIGSAYQHHKRLTEWKDKWPVFKEVHSKALQKTVERFYDNLGTLSDKKEKGYEVGELRWKSPREYQSMTYSQSGFKLTTWLIKTYDAVFVEDLNVSGMVQQRGNARNKQDAAWRRFIEMLEYKGDLYGTHVVQVNPRGTTTECAECGVETEKPLWVREHNCPSCGFEADRDANASYTVLQRGLQEVGLGQAELTPVETATAVETDGAGSSSVPASRVIETGSLGVVRKTQSSVMTRDDVSRTT